MSIRGAFLFFSAVILAMAVRLSGQGIQPYPNAVTNRQFYPKTPLTPPPVNTVFTDPDLGALLIRVTDQNTDPKGWNGFLYNPPQDKNEWSVDNSKFFVLSGYDDASLAFAFDPSTMAISSLPGSGPGGGLIIPLRSAPTFSFLDPDLMYGTELKKPLTISTYRFSTATTTELYNTTTCATDPPLVAGPNESSNDLTISDDDSRISISAGGNAVGNHPFVIVYDQTLGCRWYITQTGQIGGAWGPAGQASTTDRFLYDHSKISGNGQYMRIAVGKGFYIWDTTSLNVVSCMNHEGPLCAGYGAVGYDTYINEPGVLDELNTYRRPLGDLTDYTQLINPLPLPHYWGMEINFAWNDGRLNTNLPVCATAYNPNGGMKVVQPYDGEIFCIETDLLASTVWRFAHNRAVWNPIFPWTQPLGNLSLDGHFFAFTSSWDSQVGVTKEDGDPRTDVWIVKLD
jgi:hypothetical protein